MLDRWELLATLVRQVTKVDREQLELLVTQDPLDLLVSLDFKVVLVLLDRLVQLVPVVVLDSREIWVQLDNLATAAVQAALVR